MKGRIGGLVGVFATGMISRLTSGSNRGAMRLGSAAAPQAGISWEGSFARALVRIAAAHERHRQRRALAALDDRLLRDVGLSHQQADQEVAKPFWDG